MIQVTQFLYFPPEWHRLYKYYEHVSREEAHETGCSQIQFRPHSREEIHLICQWFCYHVWKHYYKEGFTNLRAKPYNCCWEALNVELLSNESSNVNKLDKRLRLKHRQHRGKSKEFFTRTLIDCVLTAKHMQNCMHIFYKAARNVKLHSANVIIAVIRLCNESHTFHIMVHFKFMVCCFLYQQFMNAASWLHDVGS